MPDNYSRSPEPSQHHESARHNNRLRRRNLPPRLPRRNTCQIVPPKRHARQLPSPTLLHLEHANHAAISPELEHLPSQPNALQPIQVSSIPTNLPNKPY